MNLEDELTEAEASNMHAAPCQLCKALGAMEPEISERVSRIVAEGTIGTTKLSTILKNHGYLVNTRAIYRHKSEEH